MKLKNIQKNHLLIIGGTGFISHHYLNFALKFSQNEIFKSKADIKKMKRLEWKPRINLQNVIKLLLE